MTDARAIFLDEPTTGLDSDSAEQLISLLSHLATHKFRTVRAALPSWPPICPALRSQSKSICALWRQAGTHMRQHYGLGAVCCRMWCASEPCMAWGENFRSVTQPCTDMWPACCMCGPQIVCTIHQPSSDICERFDDLILLSCGRMLYCGRWGAADAYFAAAGFECAPLHACFLACHCCMLLIWAKE